MRTAAELRRRKEFRQNNCHVATSRVLMGLGCNDVRSRSSLLLSVTKKNWIFKSGDISEDLARTMNPLRSSKSQIICTFQCTRHNVPEKFNLYQYPPRQAQIKQKKNPLEIIYIPITNFTEIKECCAKFEIRGGTPTMQDNERQLQLTSITTVCIP
jgi:hypothetical protein